MNEKVLYKEKLLIFIIERLTNITSLDKANINYETFLIGNDKIIKSSELFDLFMDLEIFAKDSGYIFDWPQMILKNTNNGSSLTIEDLIKYILKENKIS